MTPGAGRFLILVGAVIVLIGIFFAAGGKIPWIGRLPGDIYVRRENFSFYFPITTCIVLSLLLTLLLRLFRR